MTTTTAPRSLMSPGSIVMIVAYALATMLGALLYAVGWLAASSWRGLRWCGRAVKVGWRDGSAS